MRKAIGVVLLLFIVFSACKQSSRSWSNTNLTQSTFLNAIVTAGSLIYTAGVNDNQKGTLWVYNNGSWTVSYTNNNISTLYDIAVANNDSLYLGGHNATTGSVLHFTPSTGLATDTGLTEAIQVYALLYVDGLLYAGGKQTLSTGQVWLYQNEVWSNTHIPNLGHIDALGAFDSSAVYASGVDAATNFARVYVYSNGSWSNTNLPSKTVNISGIAVTSTGVVYAGGTDSNYTGQVWKYFNGQWSSLQLTDAQHVDMVILDNNGTLYVGGQDNHFAGQVWFYSGAQWINTGLTGSEEIVDLTPGTNNSIFAAGSAINGDGQVWLYSIH